MQEDVFAEKSVILIDDEEDILSILKESISDYGFERISTCQDGQKALEVLSTDPHDIIFSDINMPNIDGITLLSTLREKNVFFRAFVLITGKASKQSAIEALKLGAFDYIEKPFHQEIDLCIENLRQYFEQEEKLKFHAEEDTNVTTLLTEIQRSFKVLEKQESSFVRTPANAAIRYSYLLSEKCTQLHSIAQELIATTLKIRSKINDKDLMKEINKGYQQIDKLQSRL